MRWRAAWLVVAVLTGGGCLNINCDPEDRCPGHAVYDWDWNLSECDCPLRSDIARRSLEGAACTQPGLLCVDDYPGSGNRCRCAPAPDGGGVWSCGSPDFAATSPPDFAIVDFAAVDGSGGD